MMKTKSSTASLLVISSLLLATACATTEPNQRIVDAQSRLAASYNDKETAERGQGDLANAKTSLDAAESSWKKGDKEVAEHKLVMGQTYLDLAQTRGDQARVEKQNAELSTQARLAAKDQVIANKDQQLAQARDQMREYNMQITELGSTMVLQDVSFETGKSQLLPGGVNRLQPLVNYLKLSPETNVRVEGFTDNVGGAAYNQQLSLDRANSVKTALVSGGVAPERITTVGSGLSKPVATNATTAGRQANRRVEVTLLKQPNSVAGL